MYNVTVSVSHPAHAPCEVGLSGPESHTPERMSELLLQAADAVQRRMGWPSILEELATLRATVLGVRSALDVDPETPNEKLAEVARTHYGGNVGTQTWATLEPMLQRAGAR